MANILVIDDEKPIRNALIDILSYEKYKVKEAEDGPTGIKTLNDTFNVVLCDIKMPKMDGIEVLQAIQEKHPEIPVIMISGHGNIETALECVKKGAFDFIEKPIDLNRLLLTVRNALERTDLIQETKKLKRKIPSKLSTQIIGESKPIKHILEMIEKVAPTDARVLITGANGTGKELVARSIHEQSIRTKRPFIELNCAAIPSELIESELFGHEKGAFTSAVKQRKGMFEQAEGGTLFLDEIGDMSLSAQAKVLRALQEHKITRVGGEKEIKVNVRVLAATNKNLREEIAEGRFREDLYHRLSVILMEVPPLNDRRDDIPLLLNFFLDKLAAENGTKPTEIKADAVKALQAYDWTGNIRELRNVAERLTILGQNPITKKDVELFASK